MKREWEEVSDWKGYAGLRFSQRVSLYNDAMRGDKQAIATFKQVQRSLKSEVNRRLRMLESKGYDYGKAYNNLMYYLQTQLKSNRALSWTKLGRDFDKAELQNRQMVKFLNMEESDWRKFQKNEKWKYKNLYKKFVEDRAEERAERGLETKFFKTYRDSREFLRFLGNEEVSAALDSFGTSDIVVPALFDAYNKGGVDAFKLLEIGFAEYNAGKVAFDEAVLRGGIKLEDYYSGKPTS